jgi:hypothetical protein
MSEAFAKTIQSPHRAGTFMRHALRLIVRALPNRTGRDSAVDISGIVQSVKIDEEIGKGTKQKDMTGEVVVFDYDFSMQEVAFFSEGHRIAIAIHDGLDIRDFGDFIITNPDRKYGDGTTLGLKIRSEKAKNQLQNVSYKWENATVTQALESLWRSLGYNVDITHTTTEFAEISMVNETPTQFTNKKAVELGYNWKIESGVFVCKPLEEMTVDLSAVPLKFRPPYPEIGTIISARSQSKTDRSRGGQPKPVGIDFSSGGFDEGIMRDLINAGSVRGAVEQPVVVDATRKPSYRATDVSRYRLLSLLKNANDEDIDDPDSALPAADTLTYSIPGMEGTVARKPEQVQQTKDAIFVRNAVDNYELQLVTWGRAAMVLGGIVPVEGLSPEDNGKWLIKKIAHVFDSNYKQTITMYRNRRQALAKRKKIRR